jgi:uncharacterized protein DUF5996
MTATLPPLPLEGWQATKDTLHLFFQIVGKIRLVTEPPRNHWWHAPLYVTPRGAGTGPIPAGHSTFDMNFDLIDHQLVVVTSDGRQRTIALSGLSVADFYSAVFRELAGLGITPRIIARPYGVPMTEPFATDAVHATYDPEYVRRFHQVLLFADETLKTFSGWFAGKSSPVHLFWHSFDLAVTRFSGRRAPEMPAADRVTREAYSHEVISFGFWTGDATVPAPAFYSYTAPEPPGLAEVPLTAGGTWAPRNGSHLALLMYEDVRTSASPRETVLAFLESAYQAGAALAGWDVAALRSSFAPERSLRA